MKLGTKLILSLAVTVVLIMTIHGYLSIEQEREAVTTHIRIGMHGFSRAIQSTLGDFYGDRQSLQETQAFVDAVGPEHNIHGVIVYNMKGEKVATSASLRETKTFPDLDPRPLVELDPKPVLQNGKGIDGYIRGPDLLVYYRMEPIFDSEDKVVGAFVIGRQGSRLIRTIETRRNRIVATTSVLIFLVCILILVIVRRSISRPINDLIERIREIGKGHWEQRIAVSGHDEVSSLAQEFNRMCERLQESYARLVKEQEEKLKLERDLRHSEKLASVGQLAAGLAHEIGTPLNIIGGRAEYLLRRPRSAEEINDTLHTIRSQIDRIAGIVRQLLEFSRRKEPTLRPLSISWLLSKVQKLLQHKIQEKGVKLDLDVSEPLPMIEADPDLLQQVFINLYLNSLHEMSSGGTIKIRAALNQDSDSASQTANGRNTLKVTFEDNGPGIPAEHIERVFDPFFTTKDIGEGTGLGLSVTYGIVKDHRGDIRVESEPGQFTRFVIYLPISTPPMNSEAEA